MGNEFRIAVGGRTDGPAIVRQAEDLELAFYPSMPKKFCDEILHRYFVSDTLDLSPGPGEMAEASIDNCSGYLGICCSEYHADMLAAKMENYVLKLMSTESLKSTHYHPKCAAAFGKQPSKAKGDKPKKQKKPKNKKMTMVVLRPRATPVLALPRQTKTNVNPKSRTKLQRRSPKHPKRKKGR